MLNMVRIEGPQSQLGYTQSVETSCNKLGNADLSE